MGTSPRNGSRTRRVGAAATITAVIVGLVTYAPFLVSPVADALECTTNWTGAAANGQWADDGNWDNGAPTASSVACIADVGGNGVDVDITLPGSVVVAGIVNAERIVQPAFTGVTIGAGGSVLNSGMWRLSDGNFVDGVTGGDPVTFVNEASGRIEQIGTSPSTMHSSIGVSNSGTIAVGAGALSIQRPESWVGTTFEVAEGANLFVTSVDAVTQWSGTYDLTGGGHLTVSGVVDAFGVQWAFGPGEAALTAVTVDTTAGPFTVTGTLDTDTVLVQGDGFSIAAGGVHAQQSFTLLALDEGAEVTNQGLLVFTDGGGITGAFGGDPESFTNAAGGTIRKVGTSPSTIDGAVGLMNAGLIDVQDGNLHVHRPASWPGTTFQVESGSTLFVSSVDAVTQWSGSYDLTGGGNVDVTGELDAFGVQWAFGPGEASLNNVVIDTTAGDFDVVGSMSTNSLTVLGDGYSIASGGTHTQQQFTTLFLGEGADVTNAGLLLFDDGGGVSGSFGPETESFTNAVGGTIRKVGTSASTIDGSVLLSNAGTIDVQDGNLAVHRPGSLPGTTFQVGTGSTLFVSSVDEVTQWSGVYDLTGGGQLNVSGELDAFGVQWAFGPGEATMNSVAIDTSAGGFQVIGTLSTNSLVVRGDGYSIAPGGTHDQQAFTSLFLGEDADVVNNGLWLLNDGAGVGGTFVGEVESFTNSAGGTIRKLGTSPSVFDGSVSLSNAGVLDVQDGNLHVLVPTSWPGTTFQVETGATLYVLSHDNLTQWSGAYDLIGGGHINVTGELDAFGVQWMFGPGEASLNSAAIDTTAGDFDVVGTLSTDNLLVRGDGYSIATGGTHEQQAFTALYLDEGASVTNAGTIRFVDGGGVFTAVTGGAGGTFENASGGVIEKLGTSITLFDNAVALSNAGVISVAAGSLAVHLPASWPGTTYLVDEFATLDIHSVDGVSQWSGTHDLEGGGLLVVTGEVDAFGVDWAFEPGEARMDSTTIDTTAGPFRVVGTLSANGLGVRGTEYRIEPGGEHIQSAFTGLNLDEGAGVQNRGLISFVDGGGVLGTLGGAAETVTNFAGGSIVKSGSSTTVVDSAVTLSNVGLVRSTSGVLVIFDVAQVTGGVLSAGTYFADSGNIGFPEGVQQIASGAVVHLRDDGTIAELAQLDTVAGTLRLSGGADLTTAGNLSNTGTLRVGPASTLTIDGDFTTSGLVITEIAGPSDDGAYGVVVATGTATLGGVYEAVTDPLFNPTSGNAYDVVRYDARLGTFSSHLVPLYQFDYDPGTATLLRLTVGTAPAALPGGPYLLQEGGSAAQLNGTGSSDPDGTIVTYAWTPTTGIDDPAAASPFLTPPDDDTEYQLLLTVTDDDGLTDSTPTTVTVANVAPVVGTISLPATTDDDTEVLLSAPFTDQGADDTHSATITWGDGAVDEITSATSPVSGTHSYADPGDYQVTVCVTDDDLGADCESAFIHVSDVNLPPDVVVFDTPYQVPEGQTVFPVFSVNDPDGPQPLTYEFSVPANAPGSLSVFPDYATFTSTDDGSFDITMTVCDAALACTTVTMPVVVLNVAPFIDLFVPSPVDIGELVTAQPSTADVPADPLTITVNWGDGSPTSTATTHTYDAAGTYTVTACAEDDDGAITCDTASITVEDANVNADPVAVDDASDAETNGPAVSIFVLGNDFDPDNDEFGISAFDATSVEGGVVVCTTGLGVFEPCQYTPPADFAGTDTFTYTIADESGATATATVTIDVAPDQPPVAVDDEYTVLPSEGPVQLLVLENDFDPDFNGLDITAFDAVSTAGGVVSCGPETCEYTAPPGFGTDTFTYTVTASGLSDSATVTITRADCPDPRPALSTQSGLVVGYRWLECAGLEANGVVAESPTTILPVDADGGWLMTSGTLENAAGPNDSTGETTTWNTSTRGARDVSIVRLDLDVPADAVCLAFEFTFGSEEYPEFVGAYNDAFLAELDTSSWATVGNDITAPANFAFDGAGGVVSVNSSFFEPGRVVENGGWEYDGSTGRLTARTPVTAGAHSIYLSVFDANDSALDSGVLIDGLRTSTTTCEPGAGSVPVAIDDEVTTDEDTPVVIDVLANDDDADGDPLSVTIVSQPDQGSVTVNPDHTVTYTPPADWSGTTTFTYMIGDGTGGTDTATVTVTVLPVNDDPVADAGDDVTVPEGTVVQLDASASRDIDSTVLAYQWEPAALVSDASSSTPMFTPTDNGTTTFTVTVCDDAVPAACNTDTVDVTATNVAPQVDLAVPSPVDEDTVVTATGTFTDPGAADTHTATIDWDDGTIDTLGVVTSPVTPSHTYTAPGTYNARLCVTDDDGALACDLAAVVVDAVNGAPTADAGDDVTVPEGTLVELDGSGSSDPDSAPLSYSWEPAGLVSDASSATPTFTPTDNGTFVFTLTVCDDGVPPACDTDTVEVTATNVAPEVTLVVPSPVNEDGEVFATGTFTDPGSDDTHTATIDWGDGTVDELGSIASPPSHTYTTPGTHIVRLCVTDDDGALGCDLASITVEPNVVCASHSATLSNGVPGTDDGAVSVTVDGTGAFGSAVPVGGPAQFDPIGPVGPASTTYTSNLYVSATDVLLDDECSEVESQTPTSFVTTFVRNGLEFRLTQTLSAIGPTGSVLTQTYEITNPETVGVATSLVRHVDGDLFFDGTIADRAGASGADGAVLFEFDASDSADQPATFFGISGSLAGDATPDRWTIQPYDYRSAIVTADGVPAADDGVVHLDADDNLFVDDPYDVTVSQHWDTLIAASGTVTFTTITDFGRAPANQPPDAVDDASTTEPDLPVTIDVLANDTDPDGDPLEIVEVGSPLNGTATVVSGGVEYVPAPGFTGTDTFTYTIVDGRGGADTATVTVTIAAANQPPVADAGEDVTAPEGTAIVLDGTGSSDPDGDPLTYLWEPGEGLLDPSLPAMDYNVRDDGTTTFTLTVCDDAAPPACDSDTVDIMGTNVAPFVQLFVPDSVDVDHTFYATATEHDPGGADTHTATIDWGDGIVDDLGTIDMLVLPQHAYSAPGTYTVEFCVTDDDGGLACAFDTILVEDHSDQPPVAVDDAYTVLPAEDAVVLNVLENDSDPDGDALEITAFDAVSTAGGAVSCDAFVCSYTPPAGFGSDSFTYTVTAGGLTDSATVTISNLDCPDPRPALSTQVGLVVGYRWIECAGLEASAVVAESPTTILPVDADGGWLMTSGTVANVAGPNDSSSETHAWNSDARGAVDVSIVRLDLMVPAGAVCVAFEFTFGSEEYPEFVGAYNDAFLAELDTSTWATVGNDITAPANFAFDGAGGVVSVNSSFFEPGRVVENGGWEYDGSTGRLTARTPVTAGAHSIYLSVFDANDAVLDSGVLIDGLRTSTTTCEAGAGSVPVAVDDDVVTDEDTPVVIDVLANDSDADGNPLSVSIVSQPDQGSVTVNPDHTVTYTPPADWSGTTTFTYMIGDGTGGTDTATVTVTVLPVNDEPVADAGDDVTVLEGTLVMLDASGSADIDSTLLDYSWTPAAELVPDGTVIAPQFTPDDNGTTVFTLTVCDDAVPPGCDTDTVDVTATNVAPVVTVTAPTPVDEDTVVTATGTFTDPGAADTHTATINWGDGTVDTLGTVTSPIAPTHTYSTAGEYAIELCVTDDDAGTGCDTTTITIETVNGAPVAIDDGAIVAEDSAVSINVLANDVDPDADALVVTAITQPSFGTAVLEPDGSVTYTPNADACGVDSFTYSITDGTFPDTATVTVSVTCINDAPTASAGPDRTTPEGTTVMLDGSGTDVDGPGPLSYAWSPETGLSPSALVSDPTAAALDDVVRTYTLTVCDAGAPVLCDDDSTVLTVTNVAPSASGPADQSVVAGSAIPAGLTVGITDPGVADTHTATVSWGDGSSESLGSVATPTFVLPTHTYTTLGSHTVEVCVTDDDGGSGCDTFTVTVVAPSELSIADPPAITEGGSGTTDLVFTITATPSPTAPISVTVSTADGSAVAPGDYLAVDTVVVFGTGQTTATVNVPVVGDLVDEPTETFTVTLSAAIGVTISDPTATGTILDTDVCTILGTAGDDQLVGTSGDDVICGLGGNDTLKGQGGEDELRGGTGDDTLDGGAGDDVLEGEEGNDSIDGGAGDDIAFGGLGNDTINGDAHNDQLFGGDGDDSIDGGAGVDLVHGDDGNDVVKGGAGNDRPGGSGDGGVHGDAGTDAMDGGPGQDLCSLATVGETRISCEIS